MNGVFELAAGILKYIRSHVLYFVLCHDADEYILLRLIEYSCV